MPRKVSATVSSIKHSFKIPPSDSRRTSYRFKCKTTVPLPNPIHGEAVVQIFQSLDGSAHITSITPIWVGCGEGEIA